MWELASEFFTLGNHFENIVGPWLYKKKFGFNNIVKL